MSARILVIDDTQLNVKLLSAKLSRDYYIVSTAFNGADGLQKAQAEKPDLILLDVMMPEMNGFEVCAKLKQDAATEHIPVIMITALTELADRVKGLEVGADDFLNKPINDVALMARVRSLLRLKTIMDEWRLREGTALQLTLPIGSEGSDSLTRLPVSLLLVEDDPEEDAKLFYFAQTCGYQLETVQNLAMARHKTIDQDFDLVIASLNLQSEDGLMLCAQLRAEASLRNLPVLMLGNPEDMDRVAKGLDLGANDYLLRPLEISEFRARTRSLVRQKRHHDQLRKNYEQSLSLALVDPLTGAYNRRYMETHLPRLLERTLASQRQLALLYLDADHFSRINNTYGHANGDITLKELVAHMMRNVRPTDLIVRLGGEEFAIIMPDTSLAIASSVANRLKDYIAHNPVILNNGRPLTVTASIGVAASFPGQPETMESLLKRADEAMYAAKSAGRNRVVSQDMMGQNYA